MNVSLSPVATRRALIAGVAAIAIGAVALFAGDQAGHPVDGSPISSASAASSSVPAAAGTALALPAASSPAAAIGSSAIGASVPAAAAAGGEAPPAAIEEPLEDVILEAVDPAEALFGDLEPIATTN